MGIPATMPPPLHPTEHRGYRELYAALEQLAGHWAGLGGRLDGTAAGPELERGALAARELVAELAALTERRGLFGAPSARGSGAVVAALRNAVRDRFLERNQALRLGLLDVRHVLDLLAYLGGVAERKGDADLLDFCRSGEEMLAEAEDGARRAYAAMAADPDAAVAPLDSTLAGRAGIRTAVTLGAVGEWLDRQLAGRRRLRTGDEAQVARDD